MKYLINTFILCVLALCTQAQNSNYSISPEKPKAGETITVTYQKSGNLVDKQGDPSFFYLQFNARGYKLVELPLVKKDEETYTVNFTTDTSASLIALAFYIDETFDNNKGKSYLIHLYNNQNKIKPNSNLNAVIVFQNISNVLGLEKNTAKALSYYEKEFELYPESKEKNVYAYLSSLHKINKEKANPLIYQQLESLFKAGLKTDNEYARVVFLYNLLNQPAQANFFTELKKEKFKNTEPKNDIAGLQKRLGDILKNNAPYQPLFDDLKILADTTKNPVSRNSYENFLSYATTELINQNVKKHNWDEVKKFLGTITDKEDLAKSNYSTALKIFEEKTNYKLAADLLKQATEYTKAETINPTEKKSEMITKAAWQKSKINKYATYASQYALALYHIGEYKKALPYAKEAAFTIFEAKRPVQNGIYALIAEKTLPVKDFKPVLENWVKEGKVANEVLSTLKTVYAKEKKTEEGFDTYIEELQKEKTNKMKADIKKKMVNIPAPAFEIKDLNGNTISSKDLKGKIVVLDFWATWCGPCRASFPGMQNAVNKYADDKDVAFFFVNTSEQGEPAEKIKKVSDYIKSTSYTFTVLMDIDNSLKNNCKIEGLPTKVIIGKDGNIKYFASGYEGSDDAVLRKISTLIEMVK